MLAWCIFFHHVGGASYHSVGGRNDLVKTAVVKLKAKCIDVFGTETSC